MSKQNITTKIEVDVANLTMSTFKHSQVRHVRKIKETKHYKSAVGVYRTHVSSSLASTFIQLQIAIMYNIDEICQWQP